ncbi:type II toxin-antitoxin system RelE/ParE family toxin [Acidovorax sp.]|uniref:type II toxin-antitoxin system RelE/ParE family toxin n=1 Tax=Acidovorax sp. TaxID=1872122 RepID=UPI00391F0970
MSIRLLAPAQTELDEAISWYAEQAPGLGDAFLVEILKTFRLVEQFPQAWHPLTPEIRRCRLRRFPYSVIYTEDAPGILVLAIAHLHRKPGYWKNRLG